MWNRLLLGVFVFLLVVPSSVFSLTAGNAGVVYEFSECSDLFINVTGSLPIHPDEYNFVGCERIGVDEWYCDCHDDYELVIDLHVAAMNSYTFDMRYYYGLHKPRTEVRRSSSVRIVEVEPEEDVVDPDPLPDPKPGDGEESEVIYINDTLIIERPVKEEGAVEKFIKNNGFIWFIAFLLIVLAVWFLFLRNKVFKLNYEGEG